MAAADIIEVTMEVFCNPVTLGGETLEARFGVMDNIKTLPSFSRQDSVSLHDYVGVDVKKQ
jgi:hypothetical protein